MKSYKHLFSRFLAADSERLHFAAHSHHMWPDVTFDAHCQAWLDAAQLIDSKWKLILSGLVPQLRVHLTRVLGLPDPETITFAPNTHEFVLRLGSCLPAKARVLTSDAEFHSFNRQCRRWQEAGLVEVERVAAEPFDTFDARFIEAAQRDTHDMVFVSHVHFNSGFVFDSLNDLVTRIDNEDTLIVIDGYHGFMAVPTDLSAIADRAFYIAGGYKYAMSGEGACFMHCPPGFASRPVNTGWFAGFGALQGRVDHVSYVDSGDRFMGATFDPSGLYRMRAVMELLQRETLTVTAIHERVTALQAMMLSGLDALRNTGNTSNKSLLADLNATALVPGSDARERGHFLTFRAASEGRAQAMHAALERVGVITDFRGDRLRFGFGLYHDPADVTALLSRLSEAEIP